MSTSSTSFVKKTFDEFSDKATVEHASKIKWGIGPLLGSQMSDTILLKSRGICAMNLEFGLRLVKTKDFELIMLDCRIAQANEWFHGNSGKIIFNCDQVNTEIKFHEDNTNVDHEHSIMFCTEVGRYPLPLDMLKKICDTGVLKIRVVGDKTYCEPDAAWCAEFKKYCQQFYNGAFDSSAYTAALVGGPKKSGCFIATAAMGSYDHPSVLVLRKYRDDILADSEIGRKFVDAYYNLSPRIAEVIAQRELLKRLTRILVVRPASWFANIHLMRSKRKVAKPDGRK